MVEQVGFAFWNLGHVNERTYDELMVTDLEVEFLDCRDGWHFRKNGSVGFRWCVLINPFLGEAGLSASGISLSWPGAEMESNKLFMSALDELVMAIQAIRKLSRSGGNPHSSNGL